jgi:uncharacterized membrane protein YedE/YeeE
MSAAVIAALIGLAVGVACGFAVRHARLCTFGAIEDALIGHDYRRAKIFALTLAIALLGTQALIAAGLFAAEDTTYLPARLAWFGILTGGLLFGIGMSLVGTCAFGSLVRVGSGDLRAFVTILVFGAAAYMTLRGTLAGLRVDVIEPIAVAMPGGHPTGFIEIIEGMTGGKWRVMVAVALAALLALPAVMDRRLHQARRLLTAAIVLGLGIIAGWIATGVLPDGFTPLRVQSLTFVAPVARGIFATLLGNREWLEFAAMAGLGVPLGAFASALVLREFRWEAFDDHHEMKRHLLGAVLMGVGGVLAGGCTIGQGLTAGSLMAMSWLPALIGIVIGARLGIAVLMEGTLSGFGRSLRERLERWQVG